VTSNNSQLDVHHWILRWVASIIDAIIPFVVIGIIFNWVIAPALWTTRTEFLGVIYTTTYVATPLWASVLLSPLLSGLVWVLYSVICEVSWNGQTIGKKLLKLQVQMVNGNKINFAKSFTRNISKIYGLLLFIDWLLGIVTQGSDKRQRYFDRIAGTTVVALKHSLDVPPPPPP
jgi:uncharacterized RDD family membrane protein YckC